MFLLTSNSFSKDNLRISDECICKHRLLTYHIMEKYKKKKMHASGTQQLSKKRRVTIYQQKDK